MSNVGFVFRRGSTRRELSVLFVRNGCTVRVTRQSPMDGPKEKKTKLKAQIDNGTDASGTSKEVCSS